MSESPFSAESPAEFTAAICRRYGSSILRRCRAILRDPMAAEDAAQEVFVTLLTKGQQFRGEAQVSSWVYRITTNHCLNVLRSDKRRTTREHAHEVKGWLDVAPTNPYEHYASRDLLETLFKNLDELDQQIFIYRFLDGLGQEEIAELTGRSRRTVGKRVRRMQKELEEELKSADLPGVSDHLEGAGGER